MYFVFALINRLSFTPVSCPDDPDDSVTIGEADSHNSLVHAANTVIPLFPGAVAEVLGNDAARIGESNLRFREGDVVFPLVLEILDGIPFEVRQGHP